MHKTVRDFSQTYAYKDTYTYTCISMECTRQFMISLGEIKDTAIFGDPVYMTHASVHSATWKTVHTRSEDKFCMY